MPTIATNLQRLVDAKSDIADAITAKGGTVNEGDGFEEFPQAILNLAGKSGTITPSNIKSQVQQGTVAYNLARLVDAKIDIENAILAKGGTVTSGDGLEEFPTDIASIPTETTIVYGFHINGSASGSTPVVTYLEDAVGMTPAYMDFTNYTFNYGDWEDAFFMPKPCMLYHNGTVAYYLDPTDFTKKLDGTASDIDNTAFDGEAMIEWGQNGQKIWYKIVPDSGTTNSASIYISNRQVDSDYHAYNFIKSDGITYADHFYTSIFEGGYDDSSGTAKMRSLSGLYPSSAINGSISTTRYRVQSLGSGWDLRTYGDTELINILLILMGKSLNTQAVFGIGNGGGGSQKLYTGSLKSRGMFYGTTSSSTYSYPDYVKVFGMENYWGNTYNLILGSIGMGSTSYSPYSKVKYTYGTSDGSTISDYNLNGTSYIMGSYIDYGPGSSKYGTLSAMNFSDGRMTIGSVRSGTVSYYDKVNASGSSGKTYYMVHGGKTSTSSSDKYNVGAFCFTFAEDSASTRNTSNTPLAYR